MNANFLRSCGLAALLALSAVAEPVAGQPAQAPVAPPVQAVKKAPDRITSNEDEPVKKAAPVKPPLIDRKPSAPVASPAEKPAPPHEVKVAEKPAAKPVTPSQITESSASKSDPVRGTEAPKPVTTTPAPVKVTEAPVAKPVTTTPAPAKVTELPAAKPVTAAPVPSKVSATPAAKPVTATPTPASPVTASPAKASAPPPVLTENLVFPQAKTELKRLMIGNQAGIVKVLGPNREGVSYTRGIDDKNIARFSDDACGSIFCALGISHDKLNKVAREIMINYSTLPRKEAVAFLGAIAASPHLDTDTDLKAEQFMVQVMETDKDVHARRQATLALAVKHNVSSATTDRVLAHFEHSENLWETFPVQQYFEYHAGQVKRLTNFSQLRERIAAVKSLYTPAILEALDGSKPVTVVP